MTAQKITEEKKKRKTREGKCLVPLWTEMKNG